MIYLLLKVSGLDYLPENVFNDWSLEPSLQWNAGEASPSGEAHGDAGFNLTLPDHESWSDALDYLDEFLEDKTEMFHELISLGAVMELHVGMGLAEGETLSSPASFPRDVLASLVEREISLSVIAFGGEPG